MKQNFLIGVVAVVALLVGLYVAIVIAPPLDPMLLLMLVCGSRTAAFLFF